jgi:hypothetical protein
MEHDILIYADENGHAFLAMKIITKYQEDGY